MMVLTGLALLLAAVCAVQMYLLHQQERRRSEARVAALAAALDHPADAPSVTADDLYPDRGLFRPAPPVAPHPYRMRGAIGAGVLLLVLVVAANIGRGGGTAAETVPALELLSMDHEREGTSLTVNGLVRQAAAQVSGSVEAEVVLLGRDGDLAASGRAPLVFARHEGRPTARFRITIPEVYDVARYRVSFRTDDDVVRHVDRR